MVQLHGPCLITLNRLTTTTETVNIVTTPIIHSQGTVFRKPHLGKNYTRRRGVSLVERDSSSRSGTLPFQMVAVTP